MGIVEATAVGIVEATAVDTVDTDFIMDFMDFIMVAMGACF